MRRVLALLTLGLLAASPSWSGPASCPPGTPIPVFLQIARPICAGQPVNLVARTCGPCVQLLSWGLPVSGPLQIEASIDYRRCIVNTVCMPESLVVPLGTFASGHNVLVVEILEYNLLRDSTTCTVSRLDTLSFDVPLACTPPQPLPYVDLIRIGPPQESMCIPCAPPPICPGREIPLFIAGTLPNTCYQFRDLELLPSMRMSPLPEPPIARIYIAYNDCMKWVCSQVQVPWEASAMLPPLPGRNYNLTVELALISWCDSTRTPDTLYTTAVPFTVAESCSLPPAPTCFFHVWRHDTANPNCDAYVGPGTPARELLGMYIETPLAGLQGRLQLDRPEMQIVGLRPVGIAAGMQLAWNQLQDGANFMLFSTDGHVFGSSCVPPAMCPPAPEPVLEVLVAARQGMPIPPLTLLDVGGLLGADTLGREVFGCPTFAAIPPARICAGPSCDFNSDGQIDIRDLVLMARCVLGRIVCPPLAESRFDCNGDGSLGVDDVLCCARVILHGSMPDSLATRPAPGLGIHMGASVVTATGLDVPIHVNGADLVGAARLTLSYPATRYDQASVELLGDAASWLQVSEAASGEMIVGLIATAPADQVPGQLDVLVHFGLAAGQSYAAAPDIQIVKSEFVAPDGAVLALATPPTTVPPTTSLFMLSAARPNPFARETSFGLSLAQAANAELAIFDLAGRRVATLHDGPLTAGDHTFTWNGMRTDGTRASGGVYFYRVRGAGASATRSLILLGKQ